jgi:hypothetical protein
MNALEYYELAMQSVYAFRYTMTAPFDQVWRVIEAIRARIGE